MTEYRYRNISNATQDLARRLLREGDEVGSRNGERVKEILFPHIILERPWERYVITPQRNADLPAQIAETMWVLAGRDDITFLRDYLPRAVDFSDDGARWRGAYGKRIRTWGLKSNSVDQLRHVIDVLKADPLSRRAVINIYDPSIDSQPGLDVPCNNWIHFLSRLGRLDMHVTIRSNDLMWGFSGINAFEWSALQEIVAGILGINVGELHFSISSLHLYDRHWNKAERISAGESIVPTPDSPAFSLKDIGRDMENLDQLITHWFEIESMFRTKRGVADAWRMTKEFPEPMFKSWLQVIGQHWTSESMRLDGTAISLAAVCSPRYKEYRPPEQPELDPFVKFVSELHEEKHKVYGNSWKKRGEMLGIMANIARKIDRLGTNGAGDTAADTAIDLLCYLAKYRLWLTDFAGAPMPRTNLKYSGPLSDRADTVSELISRFSNSWKESKASTSYLEKSLSELFDELETDVQEQSPSRYSPVNRMMREAYDLAEALWKKEQWKAGNEKRFWKGYEG